MDADKARAAILAVLDLGKALSRAAGWQGDGLLPYDGPVDGIFVREDAGSLVVEHGDGDSTSEVMRVGDAVAVDDGALDAALLRFGGGKEPGKDVFDIIASLRDVALGKENVSLVADSTCDGTVPVIRRERAGVVSLVHSPHVAVDELDRAYGLYDPHSSGVRDMVFGDEAFMEPDVALPAFHPKKEEGAAVPLRFDGRYVHDAVQYAGTGSAVNAVRDLSLVGRNVMARLNKALTGQFVSPGYFFDKGYCCVSDETSWALLRDGKALVCAYVDERGSLTVAGEEGYRTRRAHPADVVCFRDEDGGEAAVEEVFLYGSPGERDDACKAMERYLERLVLSEENVVAAGEQMDAYLEGLSSREEVLEGMAFVSLYYGADTERPCRVSFLEGMRRHFVVGQEWGYERMSREVMDRCLDLRPGLRDNDVLMGKVMDCASGLCEGLLRMRKQMNL